MKTMIIVSDGLEECEALVTYDLLYRAGIEVELVGLQSQICSSHNVRFQAHVLLDEIDPADYDCLILPGGMPGTRNLEENDRVRELIDLFVQEDKYIAAICAAPSLLLHKGLLKEGRFICYPGFEGDLRPADVSVCQDGRIITGKGLGAAIDFGLLIIENLAGKEKAREVAAKIQY